MAKQLTEITVKDCAGKVYTFPLSEQGAQDAGLLAGKLSYEGELPFDAVCIPVPTPSIGERIQGIAQFPRLWEIYENGNRCGFNKAQMSDPEPDEEG